MTFYCTEYGQERKNFDGFINSFFFTVFPSSSGFLIWKTDWCSCHHIEFFYSDCSTMFGIDNKRSQCNVIVRWKKEYSCTVLHLILPINHIQFTHDMMTILNTDFWLCFTFYSFLFGMGWARDGEQCSMMEMQMIEWRINFRQNFFFHSFGRTLIGEREENTK